MKRFLSRWPFACVATLLVGSFALGQEAAPQPPATSIGAEIVRSMPQIIENSGKAFENAGTLVAAVGTLVIIVHTRMTGKGIKKEVEAATEAAKDAVAKTVEGNEKLGEVHQAVTNQQPAPATTVVVGSPDVSVQLATLQAEHDRLLAEHEQLKAEMAKPQTLTPAP